jgi:hypothetical protein
METFFTNMQETNWASGISAVEEKKRHRETEAEVAIFLFKVVDSTPGQEPLPFTLLFQITSLPILANIFLSKK